MIYLLMFVQVFSVVEIQRWVHVFSCVGVSHLEMYLFKNFFQNLASFHWTW